MSSLHPRDLLQDLLDGRLDAAQRAAIEAHVGACPSCRADLLMLQRTKEALRRLADEPAPDVVPRPRPPLVRAALAAAVLLAILATAWFLKGRAPRGLSAEADAQWHVIATRSEALEIRSADPVELERFFRERRLPFPARVFDLGMMGWQLEGARLAPIGGRQAAVWSYLTPDGRRLACVMLLGRMSELPAPSQRFEHGARPFHVYDHGNRTVVFWPEGQVLCALVGVGEEEVIELAKAKAMGP